MPFFCPADFTVPGSENGNEFTRNLAAPRKLALARAHFHPSARLISLLGPASPFPVVKMRSRSRAISPRRGAAEVRVSASARSSLGLSDFVARPAFPSPEVQNAIALTRNLAAPRKLALERAHFLLYSQQRKPTMCSLFRSPVRRPSCESFCST